MKKFFTCIVCLSSALNFAFSQTSQKTEQFSAIDGVIASDNFKVAVKIGDCYKVDLDVDKRVKDYCRCYLQGLAVYLELNEKAIPKELRSIIRKDESSINLNAIVTVPEGQIKSLELKDKAVLTEIDTRTLAKDIAVKTSDNSSIDALKITAADKVTLNLKNKSGIAATISAQNVSLSSSNNSVANVTIDAKNAEVVSENNSQCSLTLKVNELTTRNSGLSKITASGVATYIDINGKGSSVLDASDVQTDKVDVKLSGSTCIVKPLKNLNLIDVSGNGKVNFYGSPVISIKKISNSSITDMSDTKK